MKKLLAILLSLMLALSVVGCQKANQEESQQNEGDSQEVGWSSEHYDAEGMKGKVLSMYGVTDAIIPVLKQFEADTGIKVESLTMKNGEILQRLENEKESGVNIADLWFTGGADTFVIAAQKGLLSPYKAPEAENIPDQMKDKDGYWCGTSLTLVNWVVNTQLLEEKGLSMPEKWDDLLQEGLKGEVSMPDPASSGTAYNVVSAMLQTKGEDEGWKYVEKLAQQVPFFTARGSDPANLVVSGEAIVGINASDGDRLLEENNPHIKLVYPSDGTGWWPQPVAIIEGSDNVEEAKVFIDWLLSKRGMTVLAKERNAAVVRTDVERPEGVIDIKSVKLFETDFQANAQDRDQVLAEWAKRIVKK